MQCRCDTAYRIICGMCQLASILDMFGLPAQDIILQALFQFLIRHARACSDHNEICLGSDSFDVIFSYNEQKILYSRASMKNRYDLSEDRGHVK